MFRRSWRLALIVLVLAVALTAVSLALTENGNSPALNVITNPIVIAIGGAVFSFLLLERWRNLESEVNKLNESQRQSLRDIQESADSLIKGQIEDVSRRARAIDERVSGLVEEHPWVTEITELEVVPDSTMCRLIVAATEEMLATGNGLLSYQYLSSVLGLDSSMKLEGTAADFLELAAFCETALGDEYLAYRAVMMGLSSETSATALRPYALRLAVRHSSKATAAGIARDLKYQYHERWINRVVPFVWSKPEPLTASGRNSLASLVMYELAFGLPGNAHRYADRCWRDWRESDDTPWMYSIKVEMREEFPSAKELVGLTKTTTVGQGVGDMTLANLLELRRAYLLQANTTAMEAVDDLLSQRMRDRIGGARSGGGPRPNLGGRPTTTPNGRSGQNENGAGSVGSRKKVRGTANEATVELTPDPGRQPDPPVR